MEKFNERTFRCECGHAFIDGLKNELIVPREHQPEEVTDKEQSIYVGKRLGAKFAEMAYAYDCTVSNISQIWSSYLNKVRNR